MKTIDPRAVLACPLSRNTGAATVGEFFRLSLKELWRKEEGFSGKRPLGNSGWWGAIESALVVAGIVEGEVHEHDGEQFGDADDRRHLDIAIDVAVDFLFETIRLTRTAG